MVRATLGKTEKIVMEYLSNHVFKPVGGGIIAKKLGLTTDATYGALRRLYARQLVLKSLSRPALYQAVPK
jgi:hypothetical protein